MELNQNFLKNLILLMLEMTGQKCPVNAMILLRKRMFV